MYVVKPVISGGDRPLTAEPFPPGPFFDSAAFLLLPALPGMP
tara:strand:- start:28 stop:153 length:126 start_codon:yes stop_codon:yes gene_type:complete